ncbi:MAG TPA: AraC family transcriptional regulator, partial [Anaerovoracaceae bacterium]|nr:AraC family transcriptional regulator [Anaerovoracaceae bacterium]
KILMAGVSKLDSAGTFKTHSHPYYQLNHILRGEYEFTIDGQTLAVGVGDTVLIQMNSAHKITLASNETGYYFEVKFTTFTKADKELCSDIGVLVPKDSFSKTLLREIFDENENLTSLSEDIMVTYLYSILFKLSALSRREKDIPSKFIELAAYSVPVRDTIRFLEDNYSKQLTLDDIVMQTAVQKNYLCRRFKQETSVTIFECLMIIRVRKAVELLSYSNMTLAEISQATGFINLTHFNRVFTKHVMIPPGQYRKHLKLQDFYLNDATAEKNASPIAVAALEGKKIDFSMINGEL